MSCSMVRRCAHNAPPVFCTQSKWPTHKAHRTVARTDAAPRRTVLPCLLLAACASLPAQQAAAVDMSCRGLKPYDMRQCLRKAREEQEGDEGDSAEDAKLQLKQYEQPGELVTLDSGIQYRELLTGGGREAQLGSKCSIRYTLYRLSSGAYFKYSSGGTPVLLSALGYGTEGKRDTDSVYTFVLGARDALPVAATLGMAGMREGGRRRILVPPGRLGWYSDAVGPPPDTFGASRRLKNYRDGPLLFEAELVRASAVGEAGYDRDEYQKMQLKSPYALPAPPQYGQDMRGR